MEGKAVLFKEFGGVDAFPICLDTQDTEEIIKTVKYLAPVFGGINLEDIAAPRCFEIEERLSQELDIPVFHDDQHGTAVVILAGLINALKVVGKERGQVQVVINGVGAAGTSTTKLLMAAGFTNLILVDSKGIIVEGRPDLNETKQELARVTNRTKKTGGLSEAMRGVDIVIGVSKPGVITEEMVRTMNERAIVFALANPVPEIMPDLAKKAGAAVVASGRSDFPNQVNNVLSFPGIFRGLLDHRIKRLTTDMKLQAAKALAGMVIEPAVDYILPDVFDKRVAHIIADSLRS
jgi:malate dehydrogenase (oxaloacetate-decarboxylating)